MLCLGEFLVSTQGNVRMKSALGALAEATSPERLGDICIVSRPARCRRSGGEGLLGEMGWDVMNKHRGVWQNTLLTPVETQKHFQFFNQPAERHF